MSDPMESGPLKASARKSLYYSIAFPFFLALMLFLPAGTWRWNKGLAFFIMFVVAMTISAAIIWKVNPVIFAARSRVQPGTKSWDRMLLRALFLVMFAVLPVSAIDDARMHWSNLPLWLAILGHMLMLDGVALATWAQAVNRFFEPGVRIQSERGHRVIDDGPYAFMRHPGYLAADLLFVGIALALGSLWGLALAVVLILILVVRIGWEDRLLHEELPGYPEYAARVRYRLVPGVW